MVFLATLPKVTLAESGNMSGGKDSTSSLNSREEVKESNPFVIYTHLAVAYQSVSLYSSSQTGIITGGITLDRYLAGLNAELQLSKTLSNHERTRKKANGRYTTSLDLFTAGIYLSYDLFPVFDLQMTFLGTRSMELRGKLGIVYRSEVLHHENIGSSTAIENGDAEQTVIDGGAGVQFILPVLSSSSITLDFTLVGAIIWNMGVGFQIPFEAVSF